VPLYQHGTRILTISLRPKHAPQCPGRLRDSTSSSLYSERENSQSQFAPVHEQVEERKNYIALQGTLNPVLPCRHSRRAIRKKWLFMKLKKTGSGALLFHHTNTNKACCVFGVQAAERSRFTISTLTRKTMLLTSYASFRVFAAGGTLACRHLKTHGARVERVGWSYSSTVYTPHAMSTHTLRADPRMTLGAMRGLPWAFRRVGVNLIEPNYCSQEADLH